jgi:hypothetical protein
MGVSDQPLDVSALDDRLHQSASRWCRRTSSSKSAQLSRVIMVSPFPYSSVTARITLRTKELEPLVLKNGARESHEVGSSSAGSGWPLDSDGKA